MHTHRKNIHVYDSLNHHICVYVYIIYICVCFCTCNVSVALQTKTFKHIAGRGICLRACVCVMCMHTCVYQVMWYVRARVYTYTPCSSVCASFSRTYFDSILSTVLIDQKRYNKGTYKGVCKYIYMQAWEEWNACMQQLISLLYLFFACMAPSALFLTPIHEPLMHDVACVCVTVVWVHITYMIQMHECGI